MKVLVIAQQGQIRDALEKQLTIRDRAYLSVGPERFEEVLSQGAGSALSTPPGTGVVVNAASLEGVEQQADEELIDSLAMLAQACDRAGVPLIHISSCQVFDGLEGGVHRESDPPVPTSREGALLLRLEELVRGACSRYIILRVGPLFSSMGDNLLTRLLQQFEEASVLSLSDSGDSCPLHSSDLARVVSAVIDQLSCEAEAWGTYHYSSADYVSYFQFAEVVQGVVGQYRPDIGKAVTLQARDEVDTAWLRPLLNCEKILNTFGIKQLPWRAFIPPTVKSYYNLEFIQEEPLLTQSIQTVQKENFDG